MKKSYYLFFTVSVLVLFSDIAWCQAGKTGKKVTITFDWSRIQTHGSNQLAVCIEYK